MYLVAFKMVIFVQAMLGSLRKDYRLFACCSVYSKHKACMIKECPFY